MLIAEIQGSQLLRLSGDIDKLKDELTYQVDEKGFDWRTRRMTWVTNTYHLYSMNRGVYLYFKMGFAPFIYYYYYDELDNDSRERLKKFIFCDVKFDLSGLRFEDQIPDVENLLKLRRGIFSVYTGYGKTQIIATLVNNIVNNLHEKVLVITPSSKALEEVGLRIKTLAGLNHSYFDYESDYNLININGFLRSGSYDKMNPYWSQVKWIIADEVEYCLTDSSIGMMELCTHLSHCYGFSGTADKAGASRISMRDGLTDEIKRNVNLINYFGFSVVHRKPQGFDLDLIDLKTTMFNDLKDLRISEQVLYSEIVMDIFTDNRFCNGFKKVVEQEKGGIYIPIARLEIIYYWLENVFTWKNGRIINICGDGIQLWSEGVKVKNISLEELKDEVDKGNIEVIVGTRSSYRAIDLPKLNKCLLLTSQLAANVLQQIGRVARGRKFKIINFVPLVYVSCYSNDLRKRRKLIEKYFENSNITHIKRNDSYYGII